MKTAVIAALLLCVASNAEARHRAQPVCIETGSQMLPSCNGTNSKVSAHYGVSGNFLAGVKSIKVRMHRDRRASAISGRPASCPPRAWCGCWLASYFGISDKSYWRARRWASIGDPAGGPQVSAVVVWPHHVGVIKAVEGNRILVLSGNDGRAVRERWRSTAGVIAYRMAGL